MKEIKPLVFEELSTRQKLGLVHTPLLGISSPDGTLTYLCEQIRLHALGSVWIQWNEKEADRILAYIKRIREVADYPIAILTDAEGGLCEYRIGKHNAIGCTGSEAHAYAFGKATAITARRLGYNVVCNPLLDLGRGGQRHYASDPVTVARLAAAEARGMHDGGILTLGKHYPGGKDAKAIDSHMAEAICEQTEAELADTGIYPYLALVKEGLLDGVMVGHKRFVNIDDSAPATLSKKMHAILRDRGFDGVMLTDALCMMGIRAKYGREESVGIAVEAGNDFAMVYDDETEYNQNSLYTCYEKGIITDDALDAAVKRILALQEKILMLDTNASALTEEEKTLVQSIDADGVYARVNEGVSLTLPRDGKYYFALMVRNETALGVEDGVQVDTFSNGWHDPEAIKEKIIALFPNSHVEMFYQFPTQGQNARILTYSLDYDETIFLTFTEALAYTGAEHLTRRVETLITSMQYTDRVSTLIHFGNPTVLGNLPPIPRAIFGGCSEKGTLACLEVLAGVREPKGKPTYEIALKCK